MVVLNLELRLIVSKGIGYEGLNYLEEAGKSYQMPTITEVLAPEDVEPVAQQADILQIGARNMQNFTLLKAVGKVHRPGDAQARYDVLTRRTLTGG